LINWADSSVTFRDHPNTLLVTTTQSVLANQEELPSDDDTSSNLSEDLPDPNPVNILGPNTKFISNPTVDSIPVPNTIPTSDPNPNNSSTSPVPLISLVSVEAFMRSMQSEGAQCFLILAHKPLKPDPPNKPKFNPNLKSVSEVYHKFSDVFSRQKADTLPPHWNCDLKINIDEGAKIPAGPIYPLSKFELKTLWVLRTITSFLFFFFDMWLPYVFHFTYLNTSLPAGVHELSNTCTTCVCLMVNISFPPVCHMSNMLIEHVYDTFYHYLNQ
jgi:hypothetical protein